MKTGIVTSLLWLSTSTTILVCYLPEPTSLSLMWLSHDLQFTSVHPSATSSTECIAEAIAV